MTEDNAAEDIEEEECTNQRYWHGDKRNKRRAPVLKEDIYHDKHEDECLDKGLDKLVDRSLEEVVDIQRNLECKARREVAFTFVDYVEHLADKLTCI